MNKFLKKLSVFLVVTTMAISAVGCGAKEDTAASAASEAPASSEAVSSEAPVADTTSTEAASTEAVSTDGAAAASDEDYIAKVEEIYNNITTTSAEIMASVDQTDAEKTIEAMTTLVTKVKPMYEELGALTAPETYKDAQAQIKTGTEASVELLNLTLEMVALGDATEEEATAKLAELQEKMLTFQASAEELNTGITAVLGSTVAE